MISAIRNLIHRLSDFVKSDFSDYRTELEKIRHKLNDETTISMSEVDYSDSVTGSLYTPPVEESEGNTLSSSLFKEKEQERISCDELTTLIAGDKKEKQPVDAEEMDIIDVRKQSELQKTLDADLLLEDLANLILEMDVIKSRLNSNESRDIIMFFQDRIIECISKQAVEIISNETTFNNEIHTPYPFVIAPNGTNIKKYLRSGICKDGKILIKAIVELGNKDVLSTDTKTGKSKDNTIS